MISTLDLHKIYHDGPRRVRAVDGVNVRIKKGRSVAIVGPSGAGKSTFLHLLGGLDRPTSGVVMIDGVDIYGSSDPGRARLRNLRIGFVFQFYHLLPDFTVLENVMLPALMAGRAKHGSRRHMRKSAESILESVGLGDRALHRPGELSGGEAQRAAIARALINSPDILLCDEPTGNLDSNNRNAIYGLLMDLKRDRGITLVIVTHDDSISDITDSVIRMKDGKLA